MVALVALMGCAPAETGDKMGPGTHPDMAQSPSTTPDLAGAPDLLGAVCGTTTCALGEVCRFDQCIDPPPTCSLDSECQNDSYCESGECIAYGVGPRGPVDKSCARQPLIGLFSPKVKCQWTGPPAGDPFPDHVQVLSTPLVADFDFDGNKAAVHPSIVFTSYNCLDGGCGGDGTTCYGVIRVLDGDTCALQFSLGSPALIGDTTPAIGDLNADGRPDIVAQRFGGGVAGYSYDATKKEFVELWPGQYSSFDSSGCHWDSVAIHDLDDDGVPEIVQIGPSPAAYTNLGQLIDGSTINTMYGDALHPVLADVDDDGSVELVDGRDLIRFDKTTKKWVQVPGMVGPSLGHVAIADFGTYGADPTKDDRTTLDGVPELAVVTSGQVRIQTLAGRVVFQTAIPGTPAGSGGAPTIADFDGDGRAEFGVAGATAYAVFDPDCQAAGPPGGCASNRSDGDLWQKTSQDLSSNVTGSSVFDFDGDGKAEVVYADECFSRVYDGTTGDVLFSQYHTSCTWYENPIVADVDGDLKADLVIPSNANCNVSCPALDPIDEGVRCDQDVDCPGTSKCGRDNPSDKYGRCRCSATADCASPSLACADPASGASAAGQVCRAAHPATGGLTGITVLHDALGRWVYSRAIWNQHAYAVTNVNDDGTIPRTSMWKQNWKDPALNSFRRNVQGSLSPLAFPDFTAGGTTPGQMTQLSCTNGVLHLEANLCNRGTGPEAANLPLSFYDAPKPGGNLICTARSTQVLQPGACELVGCDWATPPTSPTNVTAVADDDGTTSPSSECDTGNDTALLLGVACNYIP